MTTEIIITIGKREILFEIFDLAHFYHIYDTIIAAGWDITAIM